jgi:hypothetical protein
MKPMILYNYGIQTIRNILPGTLLLMYVALILLLLNSDKLQLASDFEWMMEIAKQIVSTGANNKYYGSPSIENIGCNLYAATPALLVPLYFLHTTSLFIHSDEKPTTIPPAFETLLLEVSGDNIDHIFCLHGKHD